MKRKEKSKLHLKLSLILMVFCIGIGFAVISATFHINGGVNLLASDWEIYLDNVVVKQGSVTAATPTISNRTTVNYEVNLKKPGDFYEFTVDAVNNGNIDVLVSLKENTTISQEIAKLFTYTVTYDDGSPVQENDVLPGNNRLKYKIYLAYREDILESDLVLTNNQLNLSFTLVYSTSSAHITKETAFTKLVKDSALSDSSIDFTKTSTSSNNGNGLYLRSGTENDDYPIYYYRGNVSNNNAKFAGFCWKIVRTTETGGTKLVYSGTPDGKGRCTGSSYVIGNSTFNAGYNSPAYAGYMYGNVYDLIRVDAYALSFIYGNSFEYKDGVYTLKATKTGGDGTHHYTCRSSSATTCETLYYITDYYYKSSSNLYYYYMTIQDGKTIEEMMEDMETNTHDSVIKSVVDDWFSNNFLNYFIYRGQDYHNYLEDTVWCNDRSQPDNSTWNSSGGSFSATLSSPYYRVSQGGPIVTCPRKNDAFTVNDIDRGNGALTYPVGLLTVDETILAGLQTTTSSATNAYPNYLFSSTYTWWTMSSRSTSAYTYNFYNYSSYSSSSSSTSYSMNLGHDSTSVSYGVRPAISVAPTVKIKPGTTGTSDNPYEFIVNEN